ncbi:hypothetical protein D7X94_04225 [Acutalibacter sp. 1XD8-33]|nr:hypothetical protein D7X94_04225 [Acutalibacter sp. 1XD8-33]
MGSLFSFTLFALHDSNGKSRKLFCGLPGEVLNFPLSIADRLYVKDFPIAKSLRFLESKTHLFDTSEVF